MKTWYINNFSTYRFPLMFMYVWRTWKISNRLSLFHEHNRKSAVHARYDEKCVIHGFMMSSTWYVFSGGCLWLQEAFFPYGVGGKACPHDFCSSGMQHRPNPATWLLLEGTTEQPCKTYDHVLFVSLPYSKLWTTNNVLTYEILVPLVLYSWNFSE